MRYDIYIYIYVIRRLKVKKILDSYNLHGIIRLVESRRLTWHEYV